MPRLEVPFVAANANGDAVISHITDGLNGVATDANKQAALFQLLAQISGIDLVALNAIRAYAAVPANATRVITEVNEALVAKAATY